MKKEEGAWVDVVKVEKLAEKQQEQKKKMKQTNDDASGARASDAIAVATAAVAVASSPYPDLKRPSMEECWFARDALAQLHSTFFAKYEQDGLNGGHAIGPGKGARGGIIVHASPSYVVRCVRRSSIPPK